MERQDIYNAVVDILDTEGEDAEVLTNFIEAVQNGAGETWVEHYQSERAARQFEVTPVPGEDTIVDKDVDVPPIVLIPRS